MDNQVALMDQAKICLKEWPGKFINLLKSPKSTIAALPTSGKWEVPGIYAGTAILVAALISFLSTARYSIQYAFGGTLTMVVVSAIGVPIGIFLFNLVVGWFGKDPGLYRSALFLTTLAILGPIGFVLNMIHPILGVLPTIVWIYVLYFYVQEAAGWTLKKAQILAAVLGIITISQFLAGPMLGMYALRSMTGGQDVKAIQETVKEYQEANQAAEKANPPESQAKNDETAQAQQDQAAQMEQVKKMMEYVKKMEEAQKKQPTHK